MTRPTRQWESHIGRRLKLRDLYILATVMQWGSMAKASSALAMSQPTVSQSIRNLEATLRVRLLERSARGVEPTRYADALLKRSRVVFDELIQGLKDIEFLSDPTIGEVRVACGDTVAAGLLPAVIDRLSRGYPGVVVRVVQASAETLEFRELRERKVDLALARLSTAPEDEELDVEMLFEDPHRVVVGARSAWARRRKITLVELASAPWMFAWSPVIRELMTEAFGAHGLRLPQEAVTSSSILLRNHLLATGRFVTVLPSSVLRYNAKQWSLKALPIDLGVRPRSVAMLTLRNRAASPVIQLFMDHVRAVARTMSPGNSAPP